MKIIRTVHYILFKRWLQYRLYNNIKKLNTVSNSFLNKKKDIDLKHQKSKEKATKFMKDYGLKYPLKNVTRENIGYFYNIPSESIELLVEGYAGDIKEELFIGGEQKRLERLMIRDEFIQVEERMKFLEENNSVPNKWPGVVFSGSRGCGKSMALNLVMLRALENGWLTMFMLDSREWISEKGALDRGTDTPVGVVPSKMRQDMYSQPMGSQKILENIAKLHSEALSQLPKRRKYTHKAYSYDDDKSLMTIVKRGLNSLLFASDALYDLRMEFNLVTEYPVLIAIDQVNAFYWPTCFYSMGKAIPPNKLLVAKTFRPFDLDGSIYSHQKLKRGIIVTASTAKYGWPVTPEVITEHFEHNQVIPFRPFDVRKGCIEERPKWMPSAKWTPRNRDIQEIKILPFSDKEIRQYIIHLKKNNIVGNVSEYLNEINIQSLLSITDGNPHEIRKIIFNPFY